MKKSIFITLLLLVILSSQLSASGNIYSRYGIGDFQYSYSARRLALGELGIATADFDYLNTLNPAGWTKLQLTRFETGATYKGNTLSSNEGSAFHSNSIFSGVMFGFPIDREKGISFVAGITPYSNVDYELFFNESDPLVGEYDLSYIGEGGIQKAIVGLSYKLPFDISLGVSFDYYNGQINHKSTISFYGNDNYQDAAYSKEYSYSGVGYTIGLITNNLASLVGLDNLKDLKLGLLYNSGQNINTDTTEIATTLLGDISNYSGVVPTNIPSRLGIGLTMIWSDDYLVQLDYTYQKFSKYSKNNILSDNMRDVMKVSAGLEYRKAEYRSQSFWEQVMLRGGLSYEQTQYTFDGIGIDQISVYAGFSIPLSISNTLDFGFQYGSRGTLNKNLIKENIYKFSITLSIGELWFIRQDR